MNSLTIGLIASHILVGTLVYVIMDYKIKKEEKLNKALLDDDKMIIDELNGMLVKCHEQANKSDIHH